MMKLHKNAHSLIAYPIVSLGFIIALISYFGGLVGNKWLDKRSATVRISTEGFKPNKTKKVIRTVAQSDKILGKSTSATEMTIDFDAQQDVDSDAAYREVSLFETGQLSELSFSTDSVGYAKNPHFESKLYFEANNRLSRQLDISDIVVLSDGENVLLGKVTTILRGTTECCEQKIGIIYNNDITNAKLQPGMEFTVSVMN
ncbi:hypothetical protein PN836_010930 [Ningiella sp. W23]|uniref:hypothetical protein n=1 Tax=Ningiella sp. W23 TaxID=3023715 RepID=UPI003757DDDD